jgi:glycerol uptake facilitator-like aquaporin
MHFYMLHELRIPMQVNTRIEYIHSDLAKCISEATGTFFLVLTVGCNVMTMSTGGALSIGSMLMCMIFALGSVSGAHFNPAVSLSLYLSRRGVLTLPRLGMYVGSQIVGAIVAVSSISGFLGMHLP